MAIGEKNEANRSSPDASKTDKRKQSLYFPESMLQEIKEEAARLDRSLSWVVQRAWKISRLEIKKLPSVNDVEGGEEDDTE
ncbi:MAG TPA: TIGR04563 family protein [Polyangiaceae bacterium]